MLLAGLNRCTGLLALSSQFGPRHPFSVLLHGAFCRLHSLPARAETHTEPGSSQPAAMSGKGAKGLSGKGAKGVMGDKNKDKKKPISRSARAGLQFPVGRIHRLLKVCTTPVLPLL